jgi:hypothetical protein
MRLKKLMLAAAAVSMTASPVLAANPAAKLSVAPAQARASAKAGESKLAGTGLIVALVVAAVVAIVVIADGDSDSN